MNKPSIYLYLGILFIYGCKSNNNYPNTPECPSKIELSRNDIIFMENLKNITYKDILGMYKCNDIWLMVENEKYIELFNQTPGSPNGYKENEFYIYGKYNLQQSEIVLKIEGKSKIPNTTNIIGKDGNIHLIPIFDSKTNKIIEIIVNCYIFTWIDSIDRL
jgi:hypothetical protein